MVFFRYAEAQPWLLETLPRLLSPECGLLIIAQI